MLETLFAAKNAQTTKILNVFASAFRMQCLIPCSPELMRVIPAKAGIQTPMPGFPLSVLDQTGMTDLFQLCNSCLEY